MGNGDKHRMAAIRIMAKSVVQQEKQIAQLYASKAQMNSVVLQIKEQQATLKMAKAMKQSTQISRAMGRLIQEMVDEAMDDAMGVDDDDVDEEVDKVIMEITGETLAGIGALNGKLPKQQQEEKVDDVDDDEEDVKARLANLLG